MVPTQVYGEEFVREGDRLSKPRAPIVLDAGVLQSFPSQVLVDPQMMHQSLLTDNVTWGTHGEEGSDLAAKHKVRQEQFRLSERFHSLCNRRTFQATA